MPTTFAAVVTMPGRPLAGALASLRSQVDELAVYCNGFKEPPPIVREIADRWKCDPENAAGAAGKFAWADLPGRIYFACDDDFAYPADYVQMMRAAVEQWDGQALVTTHGRVLRPPTKGFKDASRAYYTRKDVAAGAWLNYAGTCALAFNTALRVPTVQPFNNEEAGLALWAQEQRVPIWCVPHTAGWLRYTLDPDARTLYSEGLARRNALLVTHQDWRVYRPAGVV